MKCEKCGQEIKEVKAETKEKKEELTMGDRIAGLE